MGAYLELNRLCRRAYGGVVVFVDAGLEGVGADGVFGAEAELQRDGAVRCEAIEVEDGLGGREAELLEAPAGGSGGLFLVGLEVFAQKVEAGRDAEVDHDHVG